MKFGIKIYEMDETPGFRDSGYLPTEWFETAQERDEKYEEYLKPDGPQSPEDIIIELEHPNYVYYRYTKIEEE